MKPLPSQRSMIIFLVIIVLISPVVNMWLMPNSFDSQNVNVSFEELNFTDNENQRHHEVIPDSYKKSFSKDDGSKKILTFHDFNLRDHALTLIPEELIVKTYKYIPSVVVDGLVLSDYEFEGLKSAMDDISFTSTQDDVVDLRVKNSYTLKDTAEMTQIYILRDILGLSGEGVSIAVLDTGVNNSLQNFGGSVSNSVVSDLEDQGDADEDGHGTHVTGIISSNGEYYIDGEWVQTNAVGMAPGAEVHSIRVLDETGVGDNSWILEGMEDAIDLGVDIISMSLSTVIFEGENDPLQELVDIAYENGIMVVAAAGNTGPIGSGIGIPGALDKVIAVGASFPRTVTDLELWSFSGIGPSVNAPGPDVLAPGAKIISVDAEDGGWTELSGTSMATPHISGGIALLKQAFPGASMAQIREALLASAEISFNSDGLIDYIEGQGRGEIKFYTAYQILEETFANNPNSHLEMPLIPNIVQDRNFVYHHRIMGENKTLPFYIYTSRNLIVFPVIDTENTDGVNFYFPEFIELVEGKNRINITLEVTTDRVKAATGQLFFVENGTNTILPNARLFYDTETRFKESSILFDTSHDADTPSAYFGNHGPLGQFSQMTQRLESNGQLVHMSGGAEITSQLLSNYDVLFIANPDTEYAASEISAIQSFVEDQGKSIFIIVSGGLLDAEGEPTYPDFNRVGLSQILENSGIQIPADSRYPFDIDVCNFDGLSYDERTTRCIGPAEFTDSQSVFTPDQLYPHYGPELSLGSGDAQTFEFAYATENNQDFLVAAGAEFASEGRIAVFSSQLPFDNNGILYDYIGDHSAESNEEILLTAIDWLLEPNQVQVDVNFNGEIGTEFRQNMYQEFYFQINIYDKDGNQAEFGDNLDLNLKISQDGFRPGYEILTIGRASTFDYVAVFPEGNSINQLWEFYYHYQIDGSISSDGYFSIYHQLKYFEDQEAFRSVALTFLSIIMISWVVWLTNEGGRKLWMQKQANEE